MEWEAPNRVGGGTIIQFPSPPEPENQPPDPQSTIARLVRLLLTAGLFGLVGTLTGSVPQSRPDDDDDRDCLAGQTPAQAAFQYARQSRDYWNSARRITGINPPIVFAVTVVKINDVCTTVVGINGRNSIFGESSQQIQDRRVTWTQVFNNIRRIVPANVALTPIDAPTNTQHAEINLMSYIGLNSSFVALGISKTPCTGCSIAIQARIPPITVCAFNDEIVEYQQVWPIFGNSATSCY